MSWSDVVLVPLNGAIDVDFVEVAVGAGMDGRGGAGALEDHQR